MVNCGWDAYPRSFARTVLGLRTANDFDLQRRRARTSKATRKESGAVVRPVRVLPGQYRCDSSSSRALRVPCVVVAAGHARLPGAANPPGGAEQAVEGRACDPDSS